MEQENLTSTFPYSNELGNPRVQLNRRSKMETYCDILRAIGAGAIKPTHVLYKANLSWRVMHGCIRTLEAQGLVISSQDHGKTEYSLTGKGFQLLSQFISIKEDLNLEE